jgi:peptidoglycan/LPS O-acetylase OafA/YrhL
VPAKRFHALDALRIVLALCVAVGHTEMFPLFGTVGSTIPALEPAARAWRTLVFGPAAVIAFFVISGFCIHYPFAETNEHCPAGRFYARRYIRILIPVLSVLALYRLTQPATVIVGRDSILWRSTLWSIVCEEIYYALYPWLQRLSRRIGWAQIVGASIIPAVAIVVWFFPATEWQDIGVAATALTLFPVWLSGCYLASRVPSLTSKYSAAQIWRIRAAAFLVMWTMLMLHSHTAIRQTASGLAVGAAYFYWIRAELCYYRDRAPWRFLVWGGAWSYSLYLIHPFAIDIGRRYLGLDLHSRVGWMLAMALVLATSYAFYLAVERPSHRLARRIPLVRRWTPLPSLPSTADA